MLTVGLLNKGQRMNGVFYLQILVAVFSSCQFCPVGGPWPDLLLHFQHANARLEVNGIIIFKGTNVSNFLVLFFYIRLSFLAISLSLSNKLKIKIFVLQAQMMTICDCDG